MRTYRQVSCLKKCEQPAPTVRGEMGLSVKDLQAANHEQALSVIKPARSERPACSFAIACVALLLFSFFGLSGVAAAQSVAARLIGTVSDPSGAVVSGAVVTTIKSGTGKTQTVRSAIPDKRPQLTNPSLPPAIQE
ncbi:carboxypeptidase-like regulatory domain-containing protein [Edaphobacter modestus]|uniref:carboxypeptidase-like regulatory domain-containing protein n=1 Tax=Edaphobacter modestus TaxID=388466 RepID=UPI00102C8142|nr:carboxypeptidase-like regulatory domain-containing protein [Edaphobacter modestus]